MKEVTKTIVRKFRITKLGYDFMGYPFVSPTELSYHHTEHEKNEGGEETIENGVVLVRKSSHDYIHIIESYERSIFNRIKELLIKEKNQGFIDYDSIEKIHELLLLFEEIHKEDTFKDGNLIIRDIYKRRVLNNIREY